MPGIQKTTQTKPTEAWSKQSVLLLSMTSVRSTCRTGWIYRAHPSQQLPPASLCRGYNVITIPLSLKARLYLQERETKESLCKEPKMSYPQHVFHTPVIISFSFALFQEDTEQPAHTHVRWSKPQRWFCYKTPQPSPCCCGFSTCCFTSSPSSMAKPSSQGVHSQLQERCPGPPVLLAGPAGARWTQPWHGQCESSALWISSSVFGSPATAI